MTVSIDPRGMPARAEHVRDEHAGPSVAERRQAALERLQGSRPNSRTLRNRDANDPAVVLGPPPVAYYVIVVVVAVFVMLGLVMVLSSSAATEVGEGNSPYRIFSRQLMWAGFGLGGMLVAIKVPYHRWRHFTVPIAILAAAAMVLPFTSRSAPRSTAPGRG